jgi:CheY-like chemotaxis protein
LSTHSLFHSKLADLRHDLKTPIGHILGYSEMLQEELEDNPSEEFQVDLANVHNSGEKLLSLIEDHLSASKTTSNEIDIPSVQFQLRLQLNHITGYCELLQDIAEDESRTELNSDLNNIIKAASIFAVLIEEKLSISFLEDQFETKFELSETRGELAESKVSNESAADIQLNILGEGGVILVVDDNPVNLDLLSRRLKRQGYQAVTVDSGMLALEYLKDNTVDLVLLDLVMPEMSGAEVLTHIRQNPKLRNLPVIILSAHDDMDIIVKCVLLGADDYLFKPYNPILLKARLAATLEKYRLRQNQVPRLEVFISSPGDVIPERKVIRGIINDLNDELSDRVRLAPVFWEDEPLLASDTFQAQIHPAKNSDIYIGIFWSRLGSPLPDSITREDGSLYDSGSEYEYEDAYYGYKNNGKPDILVYRKMSEAFVSLSNRENVLASMDQFEKVDKFIERWFIDQRDGSYSGAYHCFEAVEQFEDMIYKHLKKLVLMQLEKL